LQRFDPLHASVHWLDKARLRERHSIRDANRALTDDPIHHPNILGKAATGGLEASRAAHFLVGLALGKSLVTAVEAFATWNVMEDDHSVSRLELADFHAHSGHYTGCFMSENARGRMRSARDFLEIRSADSAGVNLQQQFSRPNVRHWDGLHANIVHATINGSPHAAWDCLLGLVEPELSSNRHR
jgi:hypothetical protein